MNGIKTALFILFLCFITGSVFGSDAEQKGIRTLALKTVFGTKQDWHVTALQPIEETGDIPARLCFWFSVAEKEKDCTRIVSMSPDSKVTYAYQTVRSLEFVHPDANDSLIKLDTRFSGGGSGTLDQISFWKYDFQADRFERNALVIITNQGEYRITQEVLIAADAAMARGETHFAPHRFYVKVFRYEPEAGYVKALEYRTASKYPSLDDAGKIDVISHEMPNIKALLHNIDAK